jgi:predicted aspartyl protease
MKAAQQGEAAAQFNVASGFLTGVGFSKDLRQALLWMLVAADRLTDTKAAANAQSSAQNIESQLDAQVVSQIQLDAASWKPITSMKWIDPNELKAFVGKYPFDLVKGSKLIEIPAVQSQLQILLGAGALERIGQWGVSTQIIEQAGWLVATGCRPHACSDNEWVVAISMSDYNVFVCVAEDEKLNKYAATGKQIIELPPIDISHSCPNQELALSFIQNLFSLQPTQASSVGASAQSAPTLVPMQIEGGTYVVPVIINGAITLDFTVDTGSADVSIPADVVSTLIRTGTLKDDDFLGARTYILADGSKVPSVTFRIRSLQVGNRTLENVVGSISSANGSLLLGQSFLGRFKSWSVDNTKHALVLE